MTKMILILAFIFIGLMAQAQIDTTKKKDSIVPLKNYAIILNESEYREIIEVFKTADVRPSEMNRYLAFLNSRTQIIPIVEPAKNNKK